MRMKKIVLALLIAVCFSTAAYGQNANPKATLHKRQFKKPWTWLESNISDADYDIWLEARPQHPWYKDKYVWIGVGVIAGSLVADAKSTSRAQSFGLVETNPLLGQHPSNQRIAGIAAIDFGIQTFLHVEAYRVERNDPSWQWRFASRVAIPAEVFGINGVHAIRNYELEKKP